jgi:hypothetical protein
MGLSRVTVIPIPDCEYVLSIKKKKLLGSNAILTVLCGVGEAHKPPDQGVVAQVLPGLSPGVHR